MCGSAKSTRGRFAILHAVYLWHRLQLAVLWIALTGRGSSVARSSATSRDHILQDTMSFCWLPGSLKILEFTFMNCSSSLCQQPVRNHQLPRFSPKFGFTRKKIQRIALQRSEILRCEYMAEITAFDTSMLLFVDETGCDKRNALRKFGYALRGHRALTHTFLSRGRRTSAVGAICSSGMLDCYTV